MTLPLRAAAALGLSVRPMTDADLPFIAALYASTRAEELAATGWPEAMKRAFLDQQHQAQHRHYANAYPDMDWLIVERAGAPVGRLYLDAGGRELRIVDISLLPQARGQGFGTALLRDVIRQGRASRRPVALSVLRGNPARRLYARLGFTPIAGLNSAHEEMVHRH
jgi:ribosomal protein S18 acetylase RimI-like enzyme